MLYCRKTDPVHVATNRIHAVQHDANTFQTQRFLVVGQLRFCV